MSNKSVKNIIEETINNESNVVDQVTEENSFLVDRKIDQLGDSFDGKSVLDQPKSELSDLNVVRKDHGWALSMLEVHKTKSNLIRHLASLGMDRARIAQALNIKYQFVRNVLTQPVAQKN